MPPLPVSHAEHRPVTRLALLALRWMRRLQGLSKDAQRKTAVRPCDIAFGAIPGFDKNQTNGRLASLRMDLRNAVEMSIDDLKLLRKSPIRAADRSAPNYHQLALRLLDDVFDALQEQVSWPALNGSPLLRIRVGDLRARVEKEGDALVSMGRWTESGIARAIALRLTEPTWTDADVSSMARVSRPTLYESDAYLLSKFLITEVREHLVAEGCSVRELSDRFRGIIATSGWEREMRRVEKGEGRRDE